MIRPSFVAFIRFFAPLIRLSFRPSLEGIEHLPPNEPYLLVANHSAGIAIAECLSFALLYLEKVGADRSLAAFAHPLGFYIWPASAVLRSVGAIPSTREAGEAALRSGVPILVFPGGDHEAMRPLWQANRVDFNGRTGFLKLARAARVPIVPMGIHGSHYTMPILWRSNYVLPRLLVLPWLFGLKRFPVTLVGLLGAIALLAFAPFGWPFRLLAAWLWFMMPFPTMLPWVPFPIRMRIGRPIPTDALFSDDGDAALHGALTKVEGKIRDLVVGTSIS